MVSKFFLWKRNKSYYGWSKEKKKIHIVVFLVLYCQDTAQKSRGYVEILMALKHVMYILVSSKSYLKSDEAKTIDKRLTQSYVLN